MINLLLFYYLTQLCHSNTVQKMKFSIKDFFSKYGKIQTKMWICSNLLKKSLMKMFIFCAVKHVDVEAKAILNTLLVSLIPSGAVFETCKECVTHPH